MGSGAFVVPCIKTPSCNFLLNDPAQGIWLEVLNFQMKVVLYSFLRNLSFTFDHLLYENEIIWTSKILTGSFYS